MLSLFSKLGPRPEGIINPPTATHLYHHFGGGGGGGGRVETTLLPVLGEENIYGGFLPELLLKASPFSASLSWAPSDITFSYVILNVPFYDMPKRCLETFLYSLPKSSLLLAPEIYHLMGKDHALTFSEALILPRDIWYMPSAGKVFVFFFFIQIMRGGYLQSYLLVRSHMDGEKPCPSPRWRVTSFCFMIANKPAHWVCLVSMQPSGTTCQGVGRHVYRAFTASINWPQWVTSLPFARRYICRQSRFSVWVFTHLGRGQVL